MRTLLMDGDVFAYRAAAAAEKAINWGEDNTDDGCQWTVTADLSAAADVLTADMDGLLEKLDGDRMIVALSDRENWRKDVLPSYKGNRKDARKPIILSPVRQYIRDNYDVWERPRLEGDDVLGILMTLRGKRWEDELGERVCVTIDKDLRTIPGLHLAFHKQSEGIVEVSPEEADRFHLAQGIAGDPTDGYTGCPGIGMQKAEEFLDEPYILSSETRTIQRGKRAGQEVTKWVKSPTDDLWAGVLSLYARAGMNPEYALQQFRVARILRAQDYDFKNKEPILWTP